MRPVPALTERQAENVHTIPECGCWLWAGKWDTCGYGCSNGNPGAFGTHRMFYVAFVGEIPEGMKVLHKCDTPACVNPKHLFLGDDGVNARDRELKNRGRWKHKRGQAK